MSVDSRGEVVAAGEREQLVAVRQEPVRRAEQPGDPLEVPRAGRGAARPRRRARRPPGPPRPPAPARRRRCRRARPGAADQQRPAAAYPVQVDVGELEQRRRAGHVQRGALAVRPDRQDGGRGLDPVLAGQPAGVDAVPGQRDGDHVAEQVVADRADREHVGAQLGEVDAGAGGRARGGGPDLGEPGAALAGRYGLDRPAEHVEDVRPEHRHRAERPGSGDFARLAGHERGGPYRAHSSSMRYVEGILDGRPIKKQMLRRPVWETLGHAKDR